MPGRVKKASHEWRNRVRELRIVDVSELAPNPRNFRRHPQAQSNALQALLEQVGIAGALLAYEHPERGLELIDGHLRRDQGGQWPVLILDVSEEEADLLLATHDPLATMAQNDLSVLGELVASLNIQDEALAAMFKDLSASFVEKATQDETKMLPESFSVLVFELNEAQQRELIERLSEEGYKCRAMIL